MLLKKNRDVKILITGANGMVARATAAHCAMLGDEVVRAAHADLDIADRVAVLSLVSKEAPHAVINCAAYTNVDGSETDTRSSNEANMIGPENLAIACRQSGAKLVTISSDYVFDGKKGLPYTEDDDPNPLGVYGADKLKGEKRAMKADASCIVVRTGWIYGESGTNFLSQIPSLLAQGKKITAIRDSYGTPTYALDLAKRLRQLAESREAGIFNVTNEGSGTSYAGFAEKVCDLMGLDRSLLEYADAESLLRPAPRPKDSRLTCIRAAKAGFHPLPHWEDALERFVKESRR